MYRFRRILLLAIVAIAACSKPAPTVEQELENDASGDALPRSVAEESAQAIAAALDHPERIESDIEEDLWRQPQATLEFMDLQMGMRVLDYFAAAGYFSEIIARAVGPAGSVIVYNNPAYARFAGDALTKRFANERVPNARIVTAPTSELQLAPAALDAVLFYLAYHDLYWTPEDAKEPMGNPRQVVAQLFAALEPGGVVLVVDHVGSAGDPAKVVGALHRIDPEVVKRDFTSAGFIFEAESDALRNPNDDHGKLVQDPSLRHNTDRFMFRFRKPAQ